MNPISLFFQFIFFFSWGMFSYFMYEYDLIMKDLFLYQRRLRHILYAHINFQIHVTFSFLYYFFTVMYLLHDIGEKRLWKANIP